MTISGNQILDGNGTGGENGVYMWTDMKGGNITGNSVADQRGPSSGIGLWGNTADLTISGNRLRTSLRAGLRSAAPAPSRMAARRPFKASHVTVEHNVVTDSAVGIAISSQSEGPLVRYNTLVNNHGSFQQNGAQAPMGYGLLIVRSRPTVSSNLVGGNSLAGVQVVTPLDTSPAMSFNDVWSNGPAGTSNYNGLADQTSIQGNVARGPFAVRQRGRR